MPNHDEESGAPSAGVEAEDENIQTQMIEVSLLEALHRKGPALPVELAVRTYSFPEEITQPLHDLEEKGEIERQAMKTGEMIVLTKEGQQRLISS